MSNVVNRMRLSGLSRASVVIGTVVVILGIIAAFVGYQLYQKLTTNTVVAYFSNALALYPGDRVQIMGVQVGNIDKIEPAGDKMKVTLRFRGREMAHQQLGWDVLQRVKAETEPIAKVESEPRMEGRQMVMVLAPR